MDPFTDKRDLKLESLASGLLVAVLLITILYVGRPVLVPIALAVLLSFVLAPLVAALRRIGLPDAPSVLVVVLFAFLFVAGIAGLIGIQATQLAGELPRYQSTLQEKVRSLRAAAGQNSFLESMWEILNGVSNEIARPLPGEATTAEPTDQSAVPVIIREPPSSPLGTIRELAAPLMEPLAGMGIAALFVIFILLQRHELRDRLIRIAGSRDMPRATVAIDDASERLSRFFLAETAVNATFGTVVGTGLWLIGLPNPILWGILATLLRFLPYIGWIIAAALPVVLAAVIYSGWSKVVWTAGLFILAEMILSQAVEPVLYGRRTGLSPLAVIVAATFWGWLWGIPGLVLSTPLTLLIVVLGENVEALSFLAVIFGDAPALTPAQSLFQRVLSGATFEASEEAMHFLKEKSFLEYCDEVFLPALRRVHVEASTDKLDWGRLREIAASAEEIIIGAAEHAYREGEVKEPLKAEWRTGEPIVCVAGRSPLDEAIGAALRELLAQHGIGVRVARFGSAAPAHLNELDLEAVMLICLSYLADSANPAPVRFLVKRLKSQAGEIKILGGFWTSSDDAAALAELHKESGCDFAVTNLRSALEICLNEATGGERRQESQLLPQSTDEAPG